MLEVGWCYGILFELGVVFLLLLEGISEFKLGVYVWFIVVLVFVECLYVYFIVLELY